MKLAVISDIHSNLEAFKTVLADVEAQGVEKIVCLGDLVGYGPNPLECVDLMMDLRKKGKVEVCLLGNHDQATLFDPEGFNQIAEAAVFGRATNSNVPFRRERRRVGIFSARFRAFIKRTNSSLFTGRRAIRSTNTFLATTSKTPIKWRNFSP